MSPYSPTTVCCIHCARTRTVSVIERCGAFEKLADAGCHFIMCPVSNVVGTLSLRIQQLDVRVETKTKDNVFVEIAISVQYQVIPEGAYTAFYRLTDVHGQVSAYVFDVVRSTVPKIELDEVFLQKEEIAHKVMNSLREEMDDFGYAILDALVVDIDPNWKVKDSMNQINAAKRMREAAHFKADADKIRQVKAAEADAEAKYLSGKGVARQRMAIVEGLRDSVVDFRKDVAGTTASEVMDILLLTQYFDLLKDVGAGTAFLNVGPEEVVNLKASLAKVIVKKRGGGVFPGVY